ncbi:MAG: GH92 family glycosyl hydrolase [Flavobacteriales bacterium]|nr:GH92 family glycosyl hydrolase [Flavobacteriales bacterium]
MIAFFLFILNGNAQDKIVKSVNPFIGTGGHGHTFPGATMPFGMVQLSPDTRIDGSWDGCSGYHYSDSLIYGFSHTHLSGTGVSDYGDLAFLPLADFTMAEGELHYEKFAKSFSHSDEVAEPGYYRVKTKDQIISEFTVTERSGFHKYTFPKKSRPHLLIQVDHRDQTLESKLEMVDDHTIIGFRRSSAWAKDQHVYFYIQFSEKCKLVKTQASFQSGSKHDASWVLFFPEMKKKKTLLVKIGWSQVEVGGAKNNLLTENPNWNFEEVRAQASESWNKELSKITVKGGSADLRTVFYTALYHTMVQPNIASDADGKYRGMDGKIHTAEGFTYYTVFSLWDTFRAAHPLYAIIDRKRSTDFIKTFLQHYREGGRLPVWELSSNETDCMIGYHSVSVITDAYMKGLSDFDVEYAFKAMVASSSYPKFGMPAYSEQFYLNVDDEHESVSKTLEYAYDDWCIATMAKKLGKGKFEDLYMRRAQSWKNLYDAKSGFMRARKNGAWIVPFDPSEVNNYYTEANSWQYSFFVPQDISGMIKFSGGAEQFEQRLDQLFSASSSTTGRDQADITGLIGQYAHGNEPSHHMAFLYNYIGKPSKTQKIILRILQEFYSNQPDGLIGNEDCGQMSAWFVFNAMGFYPVSPGIPFYQVGTPLFEEVSIHHEDGIVFTIKAEGLSDKNRFVTSVNNTGNFKLSHADITLGKTIVFKMGNETELEKTDQLASDYLSKAKNTDDFLKFRFVTAPVFSSGKETFRDSMKVEILPLNPDYKIYYTTDGSLPTHYSTKYSGPFTIHKSSTIKAICSFNDELNSSCATANYLKIDHHWRVEIKGKYNSQYSAGGPEALVDGLRGDLNWRKGRWQGYQGQDFDVIVDFKNDLTIQQLAVSFLEDTRSWIWLPNYVEAEYSKDGEHWVKFGRSENESVSQQDVERLKEFRIQTENPVNCRFIKLHAQNFGKLPDWHPGRGGDAFIFLDEILVK